MSTCTVTDCDKPIKARLMCKKHYMRVMRHGHAEPTRTSGTVDDHYTEGARADCWLWRGSFNAYGYGRYGNPVQMAHRIVYARHHGPIPDSLVLDHLCRTPACVNPAHLQPVAQGVNIGRGLHGYPLRTLCRNGLHDITRPESWYISSAGTRTCLQCKRANDRRAEAKRGKRTRR